MADQRVVNAHQDTIFAPSPMGTQQLGAERSVITINISVNIEILIGLLNVRIHLFFSSMLCSFINIFPAETHSYFSDINQSGIPLCHIPIWQT